MQSIAVARIHTGHGTGRQMGDMGRAETAGGVAIVGCEACVIVH